MREDEWRQHQVFGDDMDNAERYLYHYTTLERASMISRGCAIWATALAGLNDPREAQVREFAWMRLYDPSSPDHGRAAEAAQMRDLQERRAKIRVACFTKDGDLFTVKNLARADRRGYARSAMWAHYADRHKGVCLVLDRSTIEASIASLLGPSGTAYEWCDVTYIYGFDEIQMDAETVDLVDPRAVRNHHLDRVIPSLRRKNSDWANENERRLIVYACEQGPFLVPTDEAVRGVVLGVDFPTAELGAVGDLATSFGLTDQVAKLVVYPNVLVPYPAHGADGNLHSWTDAETRRGDLVFER